MPEVTTNNSSVQVGLSNLVVAKQLTDGEGGTTYDTPRRIVDFIKAGIKPSTSSDTLYGDDGPAEVATAMGEVAVSLNAKEVPTDIQAYILGHTIDEAGGLIKKASDTAPYVAIGFKSLRSNGTYKYLWMYKGMFELLEENFETKGDKTNFQTPTLSAKFIKRASDDVWQYSRTEGDPGVNAEKLKTWFDKVVEPELSE